MIKLQRIYYLTPKKVFLSFGLLRRETDMLNTQGYQIMHYCIHAQIFQASQSTTLYMQIRNDITLCSWKSI